MFLAQLVGLMLAPFVVELSGEFIVGIGVVVGSTMADTVAALGRRAQVVSAPRWRKEGALHSHLLLEAADGVYVLIRRLWIACRE